MFKANINDIQTALHDEKCGGEEDNDRYAAIANELTDAFCCGCDQGSGCMTLCPWIRARIDQEIAKRG